MIEVIYAILMTLSVLQNAWFVFNNPSKHYSGVFLYVLKSFQYNIPFLRNKIKLKSLGNLQFFSFLCLFIQNKICWNFLVYILRMQNVNYYNWSNIVFKNSTKLNVGIFIYGIKFHFIHCLPSHQVLEFFSLILWCLYWCY